MTESTVAALFTTGFVAAGLTASFVGSLADQNGRRSACLLYCITYSASCLTVLSDDTLLLFFGRVLGGFSTTLQYSVFESWMVSEYHSRDLQRCLALGNLFSFSVTLSGIIAIIAGVVGEALVEYSGTKTSPVSASLSASKSAGTGPSISRHCSTVEVCAKFSSVISSCCPLYASPWHSL